MFRRCEEVDGGCCWCWVLRRLLSPHSPDGFSPSLGPDGLALSGGGVTVDRMAESALDEQQRQRLREQFVDVYGEQQTTFDTSIRTLAAAGVAVTASLAAALDAMTASGKWAFVAFLVSLGANVGSYVTAQLDMSARIRGLARDDLRGVESNGWTWTTRILNIGAGAGLVAGGILLAVFVSSNASG